MLQAQPITEVPDQVGTDLRALRKARGLTLSELALKVGRSVGWLSQIERGLSTPGIADLRRLATAHLVDRGFQGGRSDAALLDLGPARSNGLFFSFWKLGHDTVTILLGCC